MDNEKIQVNVTTPGVTEVRIGDALPLVPKKQLKITGDINTPARYAAGRVDVAPANSVVIVNYDNKSILLIENQFDPIGTEIIGNLTINKKLDELNINKKVFLKPAKLAELFKFNRNLFETKSEANEIISTLFTFTAKVDKVIEQHQSNKGDKRSLIDQEVKSNIPESINLKIPIFNGVDTSFKFKVEFYVDPDDLSIALLSNELDEIIDENTKAIIDAAIKPLGERGFVIITQ